MKLTKNLQAWLILAAFVVTLAALFGGQALTLKWRVNDPLRHDIYAIKGIRRYTDTQDKEGVKVSLQLSRVADLQPVLDGVRQKVEHYYNKPVTGLKIADHSNRRLQDARYRLSFSLEEAIAAGRYVQLGAALEAYPQVKSRIYFSPDFIYIQLEDGPYYHYEAYPRPVNAAGKTNGGDLAG